MIAQAAARGIQVVSVDQRVTAPQAHNVTNDQVAYGKLGAEWLFKKLGGKGNVVEMRGIAGVPADTDRHTGFQAALKEYPGIKVVKSVFMGWDFATAGKQMLDILNSGVKVDGVWNCGADYTVIQAFKTAGKPLVPIVGADNNEFLHQMLVQYPKLQAAAVTNPATIGGAGAAVAIKLLDGQKVAELGQADARSCGRCPPPRRHPGELLRESCADLQRASSGQALDDVHDRSADGLQGAVASERSTRGGPGAAPRLSELGSSYLVLSAGFRRRRSGNRHCRTPRGRVHHEQDRCFRHDERSVRGLA